QGKNMIIRTRLPGLAVTAIVIVISGMALIGSPAIAQSLTGTVSSQKEGLMEGVLVSAKKQGSTIKVTVVSDDKGQYSFPGDRLASGTYDVNIRAAGYKIPATAVDVSSGRTARLDLKLTQVTDKLELG